MRKTIRMGNCDPDGKALSTVRDRIEVLEYKNDTWQRGVGPPSFLFAKVAVQYAQIRVLRYTRPS